MISAQKTFGIVIASYRYGHLAAHAIDTVVSQYLPFDKIWFVDDAAGDCGHLPDLYPEVNYVMRKENLGIVANFQDMLMNHVNTDYVMFLGADNWLRQDALLKLASEIQNGSDLVTYDIMVVGEKENEIREAYPNEVYRTNDGLYWRRYMKHHGSMMYKTELAKLVGGYSKAGVSRTDEDFSLWNKMKNSGAKISYLENPLLYYRRHRENFNKF